MHKIDIRTQVEEANPRLAEKDNFRSVVDRQFMQAENGDVFMIELRSVYNWDSKTSESWYVVRRVAFYDTYQVMGLSCEIVGRGTLDDVVKFLDERERQTCVK